MLYEVFVMTTSDFKGEKNDDGEIVVLAGKRKEFRSRKQAKKFAPGWLLTQAFSPSGVPQIVVREGADKKPLTVNVALEHHEIDEEELAAKRGLKSVKFKEIGGKQVAQSTPDSKSYGMTLKGKEFVLAEIKAEAVKPADAKK